MSGEVQVLIELALVFLLVFGWGFNELRQLKKYKNRDNTKRAVSSANCSANCSADSSMNSISRNKESATHSSDSAIDRPSSRS